MLRAFIEDLAACAGGPVVTTLDERLRDAVGRTRLSQQTEIHWVSSPRHEQELFAKLAAASEATFVIAPETGGELLARRRMVDRVGGRFLGHSPAAIALCSDKLEFARHLVQHALPAVSTERFDATASTTPFAFPVVVKPRDGAGSQHTYLIRGEEELEKVRRVFASASGDGRRESVIQPFVAGQSLSAAAIVDGGSGRVDVFPIGQQLLSDDGRFQYFGGRVPASGPLPTSLESTLRRACLSIQGLAGYIGFDLIWPERSFEAFILEANPRLTTSYLGYRALANENLAARIVQPSRSASPIAWKAGATIEFDPDGEIEVRGAI